MRLASLHGVSRTATALGLGYYSLKKQVEAAAPQPPPCGPAFVELPSPVVVGKQALFELDNGAGATMRVQLLGYVLGYDAADVEALARRFPAGPWVRPPWDSFVVVTPPGTEMPKAFPSLMLTGFDGCRIVGTPLQRYADGSCPSRCGSARMPGAIQAHCDRHLPRGRFSGPESARHKLLRGNRIRVCRLA